MAKLSIRIPADDDDNKNNNSNQNSIESTQKSEFINTFTNVFKSFPLNFDYLSQNINSNKEELDLNACFSEDFQKEFIALINNYKQEIENLKQKNNILEEKLFQIQKSNQNLVEIDEILNKIISDDLNQQICANLKKYIKEDFLYGDKNSKEFIWSFFNGFIILKDTLNNLPSDENEKVNSLYNATTKLFKYIKGKNSSHRRLILDEIANLCNNYLTNFKFISPEKSLSLDPQIHNIQGKGGNIVVEGLSMAVIRKDTGKTLYYAEIISN